MELVSTSEFVARQIATRMEHCSANIQRLEEKLNAIHEEEQRFLTENQQKKKELEQKIAEQKICLNKLRQMNNSLNGETENQNHKPSEKENGL